MSQTIASCDKMITRKNLKYNVKWSFELFFLLNETREKMRSFSLENSGLWQFWFNGQHFALNLWGQIPKLCLAGCLPDCPKWFGSSLSRLVFCTSWCWSIFWLRPPEMQGKKLHTLKWKKLEKVIFVGKKLIISSILAMFKSTLFKGSKSISNFQELENNSSIKKH